MQSEVLSFRRIDGDRTAEAIYFLPWRTSFELAMQFGLLALQRWRACYELPPAIVSAEPAQCAEAIEAITRDVARLAAEDGPPKLLIGFSMGSVPATVLAAQFHARLWSIASADRGELMIWQSPKVREVRREAERKGYRMEDFASALARFNPVACVPAIDPASFFASGRFDRTIPAARRRALLQCAAARVRTKNIHRLPLGHRGVIVYSRWLQRNWQRASHGSGLR